VLFGTGLVEEEVLLCPSLILCNETYCTTLIAGSIRNEGIIRVRYINRVNNYLKLKTLHVIVIKEIEEILFLEAQQLNYNVYVTWK
jgi:hypothetical protein